MGEFANPPWVIALAAITAAIYRGLERQPRVQQVGGWLAAAGPNRWWLALIVLPVVAGAALLLLYIALAPLLAPLRPALAPSAPVAPAVAPARGAAPARARHPGGRRPLPAHRGGARAGPGRQAGARARARDGAGRGQRCGAAPRRESAASRYLGPDSSDQEAREDTVSLEQLGVELAAAGIPTATRLGHGDVKNELARMVEESGPTC
jgi:hypothetical protein